MAVPRLIQGKRIADSSWFIVIVDTQSMCPFNEVIFMRIDEVPSVDILWSQFIDDRIQFLQGKRYRWFVCIPITRVIGGNQTTNWFESNLYCRIERNLTVW